MPQLAEYPGWLIRTVGATWRADHNMQLSATLITVMSSTAVSRRLFLGRVAGGSALAAFSSTLASAQSPERYWEQVRRQFPFPEDRVPMNAANLCPSPTIVGNRVTELTREIDIDCSFQNRARFKQTLEASRSRVAKQLGVSADEIALVRNTSEANNTINNGLDLGDGDEVVIWDQNHPTNHVAWEVRAKRRGFKVVKVKVPRKPRSFNDLIEPFRRAITPRTRVLALTHASNVSGIRLPVRELADIAHETEIHVHLDGAQSWGALNVKLKQLGCDSYSASAHKWFVGPKEVGLLYVRKDGIPEIWPNVVAPGWGDGPETELAGARKFESMGQRDDAALAAIGATAEFHDAIGTPEIESRVLELTAILKSGLRSAGATLVTPMQRELSAGVCIIDVPALNRAELLEQMYEKHGIAGSTSGGFRLCPHIYNTGEHVERAVAGLKSLKRLWA